PVIQSYCVSDARLEQLNADFYASASAPLYVLYRSEAIDGRYGMFDETRMKMEMLKNYSAVDPDWNHILLKRLESPISSAIVNTENGSVKFKERIELTDGKELQVAYINVEYS